MKLNLDSVGKNQTWSIMSRMYPIDVLTLCITSKTFKGYCENQDLFGFLLDQHYSNYIQYAPNNLNSKQKYLFLTDIISINNFSGLKNKVKIAERVFDIWLYDVVDLYDLLYRSTGNDHDFGAIDPDFPDSISAEIWNLEFILTEVVERQSRREFLERLKSNDDQIMKRLKKYYETDFIDEIPQIYTDELTFDQFINNLLTFETRLRDFIIENVGDNILDQIQVAWDLDDPEISPAFYNQKEKILLQILHQNIKEKNLNLFDILDFEVIIPKILF